MRRDPAVAFPPPARERLDVARVRRELPILARRVHGKPLAYLDNAATTQKPRAVLDAIVRYYEEENANVHRGVHELSERATRAYEGARETVRRFLNAASEREVVFVRGTTEAVNLVAQTFGRRNVGPGDEVVITEMEHHSNIVPWQMLCEEKGAVLRVAPIDERGDLRLDELERLLGPRTRLLALAQVSNALGTVNPVREVVALAHRLGVPVLVDGAQAVPHMAVDVQALDCDFYAFSGHKLYGPNGIGVLYGKERLLEAIPPWQGGGDMIVSVAFERTITNRPPLKFEAGTPNTAGAVGLAAAIEWVNDLGLARIAAHESELLAQATRALSSAPGVRLIGTPRARAGVVSFVVDGIHPHDLGTVLDREGIAIRTGHHCAQPLLRRFGVSATARASFAVYNVEAEVDRLVAGIAAARRVLSP